jgi:hypothetical protein
MSARDALMRALWDNYTQAQKSEFIDAFVHELAERIRSEFSNDGPDGDQWRTPLDAADLIDPLKGIPQ